MSYTKIDKHYEEDAVWHGLSDPNRRKILELLSRESHTPSQLTKHLQISQPALSAHLKKLRDSDLIVRQRMGQHLIYSINQKKLVAAHSFLSNLINNQNNVGFTKSFENRISSFKEVVENDRR